MNFNFNSQINVIGHMPNFTQEIIKNEPMFFNASINFAYDKGGPITRKFIELISYQCDEGFTTTGVIDTRSHMLMKGFYPCIPGWHHDDVPRTTKTGQPNYHSPEYHAKHVMALVNGNICPTQFALGSCVMPDTEEGEVYYRKWHPLVEDLCNSGGMERFVANDDPIIAFDAHSFHQGTMAVESGWRWFGRLSYDTNRIPSNEIRNQVQVYIPAPDYRGW